MRNRLARSQHGLHPFDQLPSALRMEPLNAASADLGKLKIDRSERRDIRGRRGSKLPWILLLLLLVGGGGGYYFWTRVYAVPEVTTSRVVLVTPSETNALLTATGYVIAQRKAILGSKSPRRLVERFVNE